MSANREEVAHIFHKVDYFLAGEAEYTIVKLANYLGEHNEKDLESIEGLSYRINGNIHHNSVPPPIKDIDSLPFPQRDLLSPETYKQYYRIGLKRPSDVIITSRGCPFSCKFCYSLTPGYRPRSPENVLDEIGEIY